MSKKGPEQLEPHERGQVAHLISTVEGARKFSEEANPPPAEWLCVFDPSLRYSKPGRVDGVGGQGPIVDPFDLYGLDTDIVPDQVDPDDNFKERELPPNAWDGFAAKRLDLKDLNDNSYPAFRGHWSTNPPVLPSRLYQIGAWIMKVADQPTTVWWAAKQIGLHSSIQSGIRRQLNHPQGNIGAEIRKAWRYLLDYWEISTVGSKRDLYDLKAAIKEDGWDSTVIRKLANINRPFIKVKPSFWSGSKPPQSHPHLRTQEMLNLDVEYSTPIDEMNIPDEWLSLAVRELRKNLELAIQLETEIGGYGLNFESPIIPDNAIDSDHHDRIHGLSGTVIFFSRLFERLIKYDISLAKQEFHAWPIDDDTIFARLKIWASGITELVSAQDFVTVLAGLSDNAFWDSYHKRDLLVVLAKRWSKLPKSSRKVLETRLIKGRTKWDGEDDAEYEEYKAWTTLNRLHWLADQGCKFTFDLNAKTKNLRKKATKWKPEYSIQAAESMVGRGGWVKTETEHSALINEPLNNILIRASQLSGETDDFLVQNDPFAGLVAERPVRAYSALIDSSKRNEYPEWAWRTFLNNEARTKDQPKFSAVIAERISKFPNNIVADILRPVSDWILEVSHQLSSNFPESFNKLITKLIDVYRLEPSTSGSAIVRRNKEPDFVMEAINAPVGKTAQALLRDSRKDGLEIGKGFPSNWLGQVENLLSLKGDLRYHALVIIAHHMVWFYAIDPSWTEVNILSVLDKGSESEKLAIWSGFFWAAKIPHQSLYLLLKPHLLAFAKKQRLPRSGYSRVLSGLILAGWGITNMKSGARLISNSEMRDLLLCTDDEFRTHTLWQLEKWARTQEKGAQVDWTSMLPEFLRDVWPRQKSAKTPAISARLCDLAFSSGDRFQEIAEIVLPLLTTINRDDLIIYKLTQPDNHIVDIYPQLTLSLLYAVLPENVSDWPYGIETLLKRLSDADEQIRLDDRLIELNRKWNSR